MTEHTIRVLVVDDSVTYRKIVRDALEKTPGIEVVGSASNGKIAMNMIDCRNPDLVTLDLEMPEMNGMEVLERLQSSGSDIGVIVLSGVSLEGAGTTIAALERGAFDFVAKPVGSSCDESFRTLQQQLRSKIEGFARMRYVREILNGFTPPPLAADTRLSQVTAETGSRLAQANQIPSGRPEVIVVGISTGGPQALMKMLPQLPSDLPVPMLIVQHMPPVFTRSLAEDLDKRCPLNVSEAVDGQALLPGNILFAPGDKQMKVVKETALAEVLITDDAPENNCRPSVDYLFRSVARAYGPNAIGVIMTGMGNDGSRGCRQMKQRGATIIAQDEASCVVFGMPRESIEEGVADMILPLDQIAERITKLVRCEASLYR